LPAFCKERDAEGGSHGASTNDGGSKGAATSKPGAATQQIQAGADQEQNRRAHGSDACTPSATPLHRQPPS
jgi:hypothetical protein